MQATTISKEQRFVAKDMSRAIRKLNEALGPEAILLSSRKVEEGVEIVALPAGEQPLASSLHRQASDRRFESTASSGPYGDACSFKRSSGR